jgi:predicted Zn-dependent protease
MKKSLGFVFLLFILIGASYQCKDIIENKIEMVVDKLRTPCSKPITYSIGDFDTRFDISQEYFLSALSDAEAIWEKPIGRDLFTYASTTGKLKVNLVYDYRQQTTSKLASINKNSKNDRQKYDNLKIKLDALTAQLNILEKDYEYRVSVYKQDHQNYEELVKLLAIINEKVAEINSNIYELNRLREILNVSVKHYNTVIDSRGDSFEEGIYQNDGINRHIDVYQFSNREKLVRVLAHELGHALGLEHLDDKKSIMYEVDLGNIQSLSEVDVEAIKRNCQIN